MEKEEVWRPVPIKEFKSKYDVSNFGRVRSHAARIKNTDEFVPNERKVKIMKQALTGNGYYKVQLTNRQNERAFYVHRLVAMAFISNPKKYPEVNHIDEDPSNNRMENLEWCSHRYNSNYGHCDEERRGEARKPVGQFDADGNMVGYYDSLATVKRVKGYNKANISSCCQGRKKLVHGYNWKFIDCPYPTPQLKIGKQIEFHTYRIVYAGQVR